MQRRVWIVRSGFMRIRRPRSVSSVRAIVWPVSPVPTVHNARLGTGHRATRVSGALWRAVCHATRLGSATIVKRACS